MNNNILDELLLEITPEMQEETNKRMEAQIRRELSERLVRLADMMESAADDPKFLKELRKEYKAISQELYPKDKSKLYSAAEIKNSRKEALDRIIEFLQTDNVEEQFKEKSGDYYSSDKFIVTWKGNYKGMKVEYSLDKSDAFYADYSGYKCIKSVRNFFLEKQLAGYGSIERGLLEIGLLFCGKTEKREFYDKYVTKYNNRIKNETSKS